MLVADYGQSIPIFGESIPTISLRLRPLWAASANWFFAHGSPELHTKSDTETGVVDTEPQPVATTGPLSAASCAGWSMASLTALGVTVSYDPPTRNVTASVRPDARCSEMGVGGGIRINSVGIVDAYPAWGSAHVGARFGGDPVREVEPPNYGYRPRNSDARHTPRTKIRSAREEEQAGNRNQ